MSRRSGASIGARRRPALSKQAGIGPSPSPQATTTVVRVVHAAEPPRPVSPYPSSRALVRRGRRRALPDLRILPDREDGGTPSASADPTAACGPLTARAVSVPEALLSRRPFRRHIEESRPYLVLSEGIRMINAHPIALMVFWGGLTNWVLGAILAGHQVAGGIRVLVSLVWLTGWLLVTLIRIGKVGELHDTVRAIRALRADQAARAHLKVRERSAFARRLCALEANLLLGEGNPDSVLLSIDRIRYPVAPSPGPAHPAGARRRYGSTDVGHGEEGGL